jgi:hypothetical protein
VLSSFLKVTILPVVGRVAGGDFPVPVKDAAQLTQLLLHLPNVLHHKGHMANSVVHPKKSGPRTRFKNKNLEENS